MRGNRTQLPKRVSMDGSGTEALQDSRELIEEHSNDDKEGVPLI